MKDKERIQPHAGRLDLLLQDIFERSRKLHQRKMHTKGYKNGDIGLIFHIRDGKVEWIEKINRTTEKPVKNPS